MDNRGIAKVGIVLSVLAVIVLVAAGWFWYQANQDDESNGATEVTNGEEDAPRYPEGWVEYGDAEWGFTFAYPQEWGEVEPEEDEGMSGSAFSASFSGNENVTLTGESLDYESIMGSSSILGSKGWGLDDDSYYFNMNGQQTSVENAEEFEAWEGKGLYQVDTSPEEVFQANEIHRASFNLTASEYDGVVFIYRITEGQTVADSDEFRQVTQTVEIL